MKALIKNAMNMQKDSGDDSDEIDEDIKDKILK